MRNGEAHSTVSVVFDDGNEVTWEKGKKVNRYVVNGKEIDKVGSGVPDEVKAVRCNLCKGRWERCLPSDSKAVSEYISD